MKTSFIVATLALSLALAGCTQTENKPQSTQNTAEAKKNAPLEINFTKSKYPFTLPKDVQTMCDKINAEMEKESGETNDDAPRCVTIDYDVAKTNYPWIDVILNEDVNSQEKDEQGNPINFNDGLNQLLNDAREMLADGSSLGFFDDTKSIEHFATTPRIAEFSTTYYQYSGGAHGYGYTSYYVFDLEKKKQLELKDILVSPEQKKLLKLLMHEKFRNYMLENQVVANAKELAEHEETYKFDLSDNFYFTPKGLSFNYSAYSLGPYAMGEVNISASYSEIATMIKPEYLSQKFNYFVMDNGGE